ncbi:hypothetical protein BLL42_27235 (plasmid) [Pseudomonas frederiksbergensis]|uniref:Uncharacterized protein n=1 Tax=Pseudomonas frederiksbergensis TaxID=104087 RepID=A0A1J0ETX9_9PSED|nr:hypothetical protein [Pseudomonas frederiksbergensis]APC19435.1 hypothetical protein BLL42_27235 [Pseudomonas frederiksbergensis]
MQLDQTKWAVMVNGVTVGHLDSTQMDMLEEEVRGDKRLLAAQVIHVLVCIARGAIYSAQRTPLAMFAFTLVMAVQSPDDVNRQITDNAAAWFTANALISFVIAFFSVFFGALINAQKLGYQNQFKARKAELARKKLRVAADGDVSFHKEEGLGLGEISEATSK